MNMKWLSMTAGLVLSVAAVALYAAPDSAKAPATQPAPAKAPSTQPAAIPFNKFCPISGEKINPKGKTVVYKGKTIGFCCDDCIDLFNKNPEKYFAKLK